MALTPANLIRQNNTQNIAKTLRSDNTPGLPPRLPPIPPNPQVQAWNYADLMRSAGRTDQTKTNGPQAGVGYGSPNPNDTTPGSWGIGANSGAQLEGGMDPPGTEFPPFGEPSPLPGVGPGPSPTPNPVYNPPPGGVTIDPSIGSPPPYVPPTSGPPMSGPHGDPYGLDPFGESGGNQGGDQPYFPPTTTTNDGTGFVPNDGETIPGRLLRLSGAGYGLPAIYHAIAEQIRRYRANHPQGSTPNQGGNVHIPETAQQRAHGDRNFALAGGTVVGRPFNPATQYYDSTGHLQSLRESGSLRDNLNQGDTYGGGVNSTPRGREEGNVSFLNIPGRQMRRIDSEGSISQSGPVYNPNQQATAGTHDVRSWIEEQLRNAYPRG